jgi:GTPase
VVVVNPGWGDSVQASKAGLMEVADVFAINKADRAGVDETRRGLEQMLELATDTAAPSPYGWKVPIVATVASSGDGVPGLWDAIIAHREHMHDSGVLEQRRRYRLGEELREIVARRLEARARELCTGERWDELTASVLARDIDPWTAADEMLHPVLSFNSVPIGPDSPDGSGTGTPAGTSARR